MMEVNLALQRASKNRRILVVAERESLHLPNPNLKFILRAKDPFLNSESLLREIGSWFKEISAVLVQNLTDEPQRLFNLHEYRAAVITAIALFEAVFPRS